MTTQHKAILGLSFALLAALAAGAVLFVLLDNAQVKLASEEKAYKATINRFTIIEGIHKANAATAKDTITGLQGQLAELDASFAAYKAGEKQRRAIMAGAAPRQRSQEERAKVVDDATRKKAAAFLNAW